jgi:redox-sensitive bicupin YhaK (pirin superfamily)
VYHAEGLGDDERREGKVTVQAGFNALVNMLEGEASFGANHSRAKRGQIAVLGPGGVLAVEDARPGTRFVLMAGKPYGEQPVYNGPYVD